MKKRKGSLIIATCLLSVVLLIILMTMFNINRKNAELITVQSDREKAYQVARIGLNKATEEIEKAIDDYYKKNGTHITWNELYELKRDKKAVDFKDKANKIDNEGFCSCEYSYENGKLIRHKTVKDINPWCMAEGGNNLIAFGTHNGHVCIFK